MLSERKLKQITKDISILESAFIFMAKMAEYEKALEGEKIEILSEVTYNNNVYSVLLEGRFTKKIQTT